MMCKLPNVYWIDLFCGAGGTTTGIHLAKANAKVIVCVNHDAMAIESHKENYPDCLHLTEDVRDKKVVLKILRLVNQLRKDDPSCIINIWASLECTNYSKAKGGLPRDADSRTLAESLHMYIDILDPDYIYIENVREFMAWRPLDGNGRPISRKNGRDYVKWCNATQEKGYNYDFRLLNAADYGAYTSRLRYFGQFAKKGMPISWPSPTHGKTVPKSSGMFNTQIKKWKAVREVLDLEDEGVSIFERKKPLSENTLKRIYAGLEKFVANGNDEFIKRYNGGVPKHMVKSIDEPIGTISTNGRHAKVKAVFLNTYYGNGGAHSTLEPSPTITTKDRVSKVNVNFFMNNYTSWGITSSIDKPGPTLTANPKSNIITAKYWLVDTQYANKGRSIDRAAPTIIARQDKKPLYLLHTEQTDVMGIIVFKDDSPMTIKIKEFMAAYQISDINMRMLHIPELLWIQGFPDNYKLKGTKTDQKKFIGNAVVPVMAQRLVESNFKAIRKHFEMAA